MQKRLTMTNEELCALTRDGQRWARQHLLENNLPFVRKLDHSVWGKNIKWNRALGVKKWIFVRNGALHWTDVWTSLKRPTETNFFPMAPPAIRNAMLDAIAAAQSRFEGRHAVELVLQMMLNTRWTTRYDIFTYLFLAEKPRTK